MAGQSLRRCFRRNKTKPAKGVRIEELFHRVVLADGVNNMQNHRQQYEEHAESNGAYHDCIDGTDPRRFRHRRLGLKPYSRNYIFKTEEAAEHDAEKVENARCCDNTRKCNMLVPYKAEGLRSSGG